MSIISFLCFFMAFGLYDGDDDDDFMTDEDDMEMDEEDDMDEGDMMGEE